MRARTIFFTIGFIIFSAFLIPQEKPIKEDVTVTHIEIPVRVFLKGELIDNLEKKDFTLIVNGKKRDIAGFSIIRKSLEEQEISLTADRKIPDRRYFILAMNITNFSDEIRDGLDYILDRVLADTDSLLVFINNSTRFYADLSEKESVRSELKQYISDESIKAHSLMLQYFKQIENESNFARFKMMLRQGRSGLDTREKTIYFVHDFLKNYLAIWKDYKRRYLIPDVNIYYNLSRHLQDVKAEKWVISFFQYEMFPEIVLSGEMYRMIRSLIYDWQTSEDVEEVTFSRIISRLLSQVQKEMNVSEGFPTEEVTKIFTKVGATFHSVFIPSTISTFNNDMSYKQISSDLENNLRSLTKKTGGELISSTDIGTAMDKIVKKQDVFYVLTYSPDDNETLERIEIRTGNRKYTLAYDDNARLPFSKRDSAPSSAEAGDVVISDLKFLSGKLSFSMSGYAMKKNSPGMVNVRIRIKDEKGGSVFDNNKTLTAVKEKAGLSLDFPWLKEGRYEIIVDVKDLNTGKTGTDIIKISKGDGA